MPGEVGLRHQAEAGGVEDRAGAQHARRAEPVGDRAGERLADAPQQVLDRDRETRTRRGPSRGRTTAA